MTIKRNEHLAAALLELLAEASQFRKGVEEASLEILGVGHAQPERAREHGDAHPVPVGTRSAVVSACMHGRATPSLHT